MDNERRLIAYHETGHAVMALINGQPIKKLSMKGMDSPMGTGKYLASMQVEPFERKESVTINELIRKVQISLGGFAIEFLILGDYVILRGDDLTSAIKWVENMLELEDFRTFAAKLPSPDPGRLDMIEDMAIKAVINWQMQMCIDALIPRLRQVDLIAKTLYEREELSGDEVSRLFNQEAAPATSPSAI